MSKHILVLIDIQKEYTTPGRPFYLDGIEESLENCRKALSFARNHQWEIIHVQHSKGVEADRFNPNTEFFDFVEGFSPLVGEHHVVKNDFSCYSSSDFASLMSRLEVDGDVYLIGYNSVMCCLSTLEEARRKGHKMQLVSDACLAKSVGGFSEQDTHRFMLSLYSAKGLTPPLSVSELIEKNEVTSSRFFQPAGNSSSQVVVKFKVRGVLPCQKTKTT